MSAYYNEIDPFAAEWLRELIKAGLIAPGDVDERSIEDVQPDELAGYTQCHFFAGIGGWSLALRQAGWPDDKPVWTGSCPCQPFSAAGKGAGFADERHLWPAFHWLIEQRRPAALYGEQVASKAADPWIDLVQADLEALGYAFGCVAFPAASVGAPHIRDRAYWVANTSSSRGEAGLSELAGRYQRESNFADNGGGELSGAGQRPEVGGATVVGVADTRLPEPPGREQSQENGDRSSRAGEQSSNVAAPHGADGGMADTSVRGLGEQRGAVEPREIRHADSGSDSLDRPGPTNGFWRAADWLRCRDGKWRPVVATHVGVADGLPDSMVRGGGQSFREYAEKTEGEIDGQSSERSGAENLSVLRGGNASQENKWQARGFRGIHAEEVLRPILHGDGNGKGPLHQFEPQPNEGEQERETLVRSVQGNQEAPRSPQGFGPFQQHPIKLDDVVPFLSQENSLAQFHGRWRDQEAMQALCAAICESGSVPFSFEQAEAVWKSLGCEDKDRIGLETGHQWVTRSFTPISKGEPARVGRLRGYGNSINVPQAEEFVRASL